MDAFTAQSGKVNGQRKRKKEISLVIREERKEGRGMSIHHTSTKHILIYTTSTEQMDSVANIYA